MKHNFFFFSRLPWLLLLVATVLLFARCTSDVQAPEAAGEDSEAVAPQHLSEEEALVVAQGFLRGNGSLSSETRAAGDELQLAFTDPAGKAGTRSNGSTAELPAYYVFNIGDHGYVIVSAWDVTYPVLAYSDEGRFFTEEAAAEASTEGVQNVLSFLSAYSDGITELSRTAQVTEELRSARTAALKGIVTDSPTRANGDIRPLLGYINWNQSPYYNAYCPYGTPVGCVATATCQIMKYWEYPDHGTGSHTSTYDGQYANFDHDYNWSAMPAAVLRGPNDEVAQLCYDVAVGLNMMFSRSGSGTWQYYVPDLLVDHFYYKNTARDLYRDNYSRQQWESIVYNELANGRPVQYAGSGNGGGHSFVCDGYSNGYFHINWGWGGMSNGYFLLHALDPNSLGTGGGSGGFNYGQDIIIGIEPAMQPDPTPDPDPDPDPSDEYCISTGRYARSTFISRVSLAGVDNETSSGEAGYSYFEDKVISLVPGHSYTLTVRPGSLYGDYGEYWSVWIDYDGDKTFSDSELVDRFTTGAANADVTRKITIPEQVADGTVRMRVSMKWGSYASACETFDHGEVEDYPVTFGTVEPTPDPDPDPDPVDPYPESYGQDSYYAYIASVDMDYMSNTSGGQHYESYVDSEDLHIQSSAGRSISFRFTPGFGSGTSYPCYWRIWIDYNKDGAFQSNELVASRMGYSYVSGWFTLPYHMEKGLYRVRVSMKVNGYPAADEVFTYGEVEDYRLRIN